jgi:CPA2 family monovalent cation:H+ antiporter-2
MEIPILKDIVIIFLCAISVIWLCNIARLPTIVGLLLTGIISGPHGLKLVNSVADVNVLAEIGIMLLLFTIGLEFSLKRLLQIKRFFFYGGGIQVALTVLFSFFVARLIGRPWNESLFLGFLLSMSSTAVVLKSFDKRDTSDSLQGRLCLGILIFQDLVAVPMILIIPLLDANAGSLDQALIFRLLSGICVVILVFAAAIKIVPKILHQLARVRSRELFSLSVLAICFAVAWLSASAGLSLAMGAFLAGLIIAESEYRHEAVGQVLPLQDIFSSLFFVSIGMILDINFVFSYPFLILGVTLAVLCMKATIIFWTAYILKLPLSTLIAAGIALCQIGEFSFVLAKLGVVHGLGNEFRYQLFLAVALLSMACTPMLINGTETILKALQKLPLPEKLKIGLKISPPITPPLSNHIVIVGFGVAGQHLAKAAKDSQIPYVIIEMNPETVRIQKAMGEPIHFGDASRGNVLENVNLNGARALAVVINDAAATRRIVSLGKRMNPKCSVVARTRYISEAALLQNLGANTVVADEVEAAMKLFTHVLHLYEVSEETIDTLARTFLAGRMQFFVAE